MHVFNESAKTEKKLSEFRSSEAMTDYIHQLSGCVIILLSFVLSQNNHSYVNKQLLSDIMCLRTCHKFIC